MYLKMRRGTEDEFREVMQAFEAKVGELAELKVDLIHPEGAPPFMIHGYKGEREIVKKWEKKHKIPIVTSGMTQVEALRALKVKKVVGVTYFSGKINNTFSRYFIQAGFNVVTMAGISVPFEDVGRLSSQEVYAHIRKAFLKYP